ncbi:MAG: polysaccharide deacetylase [Oscillospiraceae bacterium]|nr:polysaccharide deacetylase [Oscillospiraceae bacterium]
MYFGSVRFFKHILLLLVAVVVAGLIALVVWQSAEVKRLSAELDGLKVEVATESDKPDTETEAETSANGFITTTPTETEAETTTAEPEPVSIGKYDLLYPELYADLPNNAAYDSDDNHIYLTFDDGPSDNTMSILSILDKYNVKATFFVVPQDTDEDAELMKAIVGRGHTIGVHSLTHNYNTIYKDTESFLEDFNAAYEIIYRRTGVKPVLFRFPGGSINDFNTTTIDDIITEMTRRGFIYFDWNCQSNDSDGANWTSMYYGVTSQIDVNKRSVVLFHDRNDCDNTVFVLEDIVLYFINNKDYVFSELKPTTTPLHF